jgi:hypothetical protein
MAVKELSRVAPRRLAAELLSQRTAVVKANRRRAELEASIRRYELRYGIASEAVHAAIDRGELEENQDVSLWLMDHDLLSRTKAR